MSTHDVVFLNGEYLPKADASLGVEDRGTMFGDGVYEVVRYYNGKPLAIKEHMRRMEESLAAVRIPAPRWLSELPQIGTELLARNNTPDAKVYWQVTRGSAPREHQFLAGMKPTLLVMAYPLVPLNVGTPVPEARAIFVPDVRWHFCRIKTLMLLPNLLAHDDARRKGVQMAILHREGRVTESTSANVFAVRKGIIQTHPADQWILPGITRRIIIDLARQQRMHCHEVPLTTQELSTADEVFCTGTTTHVTSVVEIDGRRVGNGTPGPVSQQLHKSFEKLILQM